MAFSASLLGFNPCACDRLSVLCLPLIILVLLLGGCTSSAKLEGSVSDAITGAPLAGVVVSAFAESNLRSHQSQLQIKATTDAQGKFVISRAIPGWQYNLVYSKSSYVQVREYAETGPAGETVLLESASLSPMPPDSGLWLLVGGQFQPLVNFSDPSPEALPFDCGPQEEDTVICRSALLAANCIPLAAGEYAIFARNVPMALFEVYGGSDAEPDNLVLVPYKADPTTVEANSSSAISYVRMSLSPGGAIAAALVESEGQGSTAVYWDSLRDEPVRLLSIVEPGTDVPARRAAGYLELSKSAIEARELDAAERYLAASRQIREMAGQQEVANDIASRRSRLAELSASFFQSSSDLSKALQLLEDAKAIDRYTALGSLKETRWTSTLEEPHARYTSMRFSVSGSDVAMLADSCMVVLDTASGQELLAIGAPPKNELVDVEFSPSGDTLAVASSESAMWGKHQWIGMYKRTGETLWRQEIPAFSGLQCALSIHPQGKHIAVGCTPYPDGKGLPQILIMDVSGGMTTATVAEDEGGRFLVGQLFSFDPSGTLILSIQNIHAENNSESACRIVMVDWQQGKVVREIPLPFCESASDLWDYSFVGMDKLMAKFDDGTIRLFDLKEGKELSRVQSLNPTGVLSSHEYDGRIYVLERRKSTWYTDERGCRVEFPNTVQLWRWPDPTPIAAYSLPGNDEALFNPRFSPSGDKIYLSTSPDGKACLSELHF